MTLPEGWVSTKIGDICDIVTGKTPPTGRAELYGGSFPFFKPGDLTASELSTSSGECLSEAGLGYAPSLPPRSVLVTCIGILGKSGCTSQTSSCNQQINAILPSSAAEPKLIFYWTRTISGWMDDNSSATTVAIINKGRFERAPISLPTKAEQRRIVAKLDALTARLVRARAVLERVPVLAERGHTSILRAGVRGELTAGWREGEARGDVAALLERTPAPQQGRGGREATDKIILGAASLAVNDPGTPLPTGWAWIPLLRIAKQETGHTPSRSRSDYWDGGVPWIGIRDAGAHHGRAIDQTMQTISAEGLANSSARLLPAGTVCLSRTASVGYVTIMARPMATSQDFATWTCTEALLPEYLMYALMAEGDDIRKFGMGSTHTTIYFPEVRAFHIALPPITEQREIVARIKAGVSRADRLEAEADRARGLLDRLESTILAKAFRGELVPQDPNDEPASILLERIRAQRAAAPKAKRGRRAGTMAG